MVTPTTCAIGSTLKSLAQQRGPTSPAVVIVVQLQLASQPSDDELMQFVSAGELVRRSNRQTKSEPSSRVRPGPRALLVNRLDGLLGRPIGAAQERSVPSTATCLLGPAGHRKPAIIELGGPSFKSN